MATEDEPKYDGGYKKVYGVEFKQPTSRNFGLNEESITDDRFLMAVTLLSIIPGLGVSFALSGMWAGYEGRHENDFCIDEQFWKSGVIGLLLQIIGLAIFGLVLLV